MKHMELTRLDKVISDNVSLSEKYNEAKQTVYILQDISETLAMIYDLLSGKKEVLDEKNV